MREALDPIGLNTARIAEVRCGVVDLPLKRPHKLAMATIEVQSNVVVRIVTDDGEEGWGEAATIPGYGAETVETMAQVVRTSLAPALVGTEISSLGGAAARMETAIKRNPYAKSAVELAVADLMARRAGVPMSALFGGRRHDRIAGLWVLGAGEAEADIAEAKKLFEQKLFRCFLLKVGKGAPEDDLARVRRVAKELGDGVELRVDVNQSWDEPTAMRFIPQLAEAGITVVEQPVRADNVEAMRRLTGRFPCLIMADEPVETPQDALRFAAAHACDAFSVKLGKHGGPTATRAVVSIAEAAGFRMFAGTMLESSLGVAAHAQFFSTVSSVSLGNQLFGPLLMTADPVVAPVRYEDFCLIVPTGPGSGVEIDRDALKSLMRKEDAACLI